MKGNELLYQLNLVEDRYIEEASQPPRKRHAPWMRVAAACLCLVLGCTAVLASEQLGLRITDIFTSRADPGSDLTESGYDLTARIQVIPIEKLNADSMNTASAEIALAYSRYEPHMSWFPGHLRKSFSTPQEARDYIGYEPLVIPDWDLPQLGNEVDVYGYNYHGDIQQVFLSSRFQVDSININCTAWIWTAAFEEETVIGNRSTEELEYTERTHTNRNGLPYLSVHSSALESGRLMIDGHLTRDGVLYSIHIFFREEDAAAAENYLAQWADLF